MTILSHPGDHLVSRRFKISFKGVSMKFYGYLGCFQNVSNVSKGASRKFGGLSKMCEVYGCVQV